MRHSTKLKVKPQIAEERLRRLRQFIDLKAPTIITIQAAEHYLACFERSIERTWFFWSMHHAPHWLLWLTSAAYRQVCENDKHDPDARDNGRF